MATAIPGTPLFVKVFSAKASNCGMMALISLALAVPAGVTAGVPAGVPAGDEIQPAMRTRQTSPAMMIGIRRLLIIVPRSFRYR
jgi:hypothetical protein